MEVVRRFRNHYLLYYYLLFLCILGSCNLKNSNQNFEEREGVEDIDEDFDEGSDDLDANTDASDAEPAESDVTDPETAEEDESDGDLSEFDAENQYDDSDISETYPDMTGTWANLTVFKGSAKVPYISQTLPAWAIMVSKVDI